MCLSIPEKPGSAAHSSTSTASTGLLCLSVGALVHFVWQELRADVCGCCHPSTSATHHTSQHGKNEVSISRHSKVISRTDRHTDTRTDRQYENITFPHTRAVKSVCITIQIFAHKFVLIPFNFSRFQQADLWEPLPCLIYGVRRTIARVSRCYSPRLQARNSRKPSTMLSHSESKYSYSGQNLRTLLTRTQ